MGYRLSGPPFAALPLNSRQTADSSSSCQSIRDLAAQQYNGIIYKGATRYQHLWIFQVLKHSVDEATILSEADLPLETTREMLLGK